VLLMGAFPAKVPTLPPVAVTSDHRDRLARRVRWLVATTISYNLVEAVEAIAAGVVASSTALIGFGLDSVIEVSSAAAVTWQFSVRDHAVRQAREGTTLRIIALSFFALATYVVVESVRTLFGASEAEHSTVGLILAAVSLAVMPGLSFAQRRAGRRLGSASAVADSKQTLLCTYLSAVLLVGSPLFLQGVADPVAALVIAGVAVKEGAEARRGQLLWALTGVISETGGEDGGCEPGSLRPPAAEGAIDEARTPDGNDRAGVPAGHAGGRHRWRPPVWADRRVLRRRVGVGLRGHWRCC
jgi:hypothetical protein